MPSDFDMVIRNGIVATASDTARCDIGIRDGRIIALAECLPKAKSEINARGRYITPGGIDAHCHIEQPMAPPVRLADDFVSASRAAACGGTTTIIPFAEQVGDSRILELAEAYKKRADGKTYVDYGIHIILTSPTRQHLEVELPEVIAAGYSSFKLYMTYPGFRLTDRQILEILTASKKHGAISMIHAENCDGIGWLTDLLIERGLRAPRYHARSRPQLIEREATHRAAALAELVGVPILLVHVSGDEAVEQIRWARSRGVVLFSETCPQYICLTAADLGLDDSYSGARCVCSPPPRDVASQEMIWRGLADGLFTIFSSDHSPYVFEGPNGKRPGGHEVPFPDIPNGIPGIETRMPILYSEGVLKNRISINRFVELTATNPAKLYGLYPQKGSIIPGADADLVLWNEEPIVVRNALLHHACDYTPYEGMALGAWPSHTLLRGSVLWQEGEFVAPEPNGKFIRRGRSLFQKRGIS